MAPDRAASDALTIAREVHKIVKEIDDRLTNAAKYAERTRRLTLLTGVAVAAVIIVGIVAGVALARLSQNTADIHASQLHACAIGNDARAAQRRLWNHVIALSDMPQPGETPAERAARERELRDFRAYIARQFRAVNCRALYSTRAQAWRAVPGRPGAGVRP